MPGTVLMPDSADPMEIAPFVARWTVREGGLTTLRFQPRQGTAFAVGHVVCQADHLDSGWWVCGMRNTGKRVGPIAEGKAVPAGAFAPNTPGDEFYEGGVPENGNFEIDVAHKARGLIHPPPLRVALTTRPMTDEEYSQVFNPGGTHGPEPRPNGGTYEPANRHNARQ
jgi:hypothetical protein